MSSSQNPMQHIAEMLETKSCIKQQTYRNLTDVFRSLMGESEKIIEEVKKVVDQKDKDIILQVTSVSDHEFHVKIAGDLLIFFMHSNIVMMDNEHPFNKSKYVIDNPMGKYLGQINVYNFMADSFRYNRISDPGYLIGRLFINYENKFLIEGDETVSHGHSIISSEPISTTDLSIFVQLAISEAIDTDLVTTPFKNIRKITVQQKEEKSQMLGAGHKIGFQMTYQQGIDNVS